jgi:hypothetical protein
MTKLLPIVAILALAACSTTPSPPCRYDSRRFGQRTERFVNGVADLPNYVADHVSDRMWRMGNTASIEANRFVDNAQQTAHNFTGGLASLLGDEAARTSNIKGWFDRRIQEEQDNAHCFFHRAWYHLQILE